MNMVCEQENFAQSQQPLAVPGSPADDSGLLVLISKWWATWARLQKLYERLSEAEDLASTTGERSPLESVRKDISGVIDELHTLEGRVARTKAVTRAGMIEKARMAFTDTLTSGGIEGDMEQALNERYSTGSFMGLSLIIDLMQEAERTAS